MITRGEQPVGPDSKKLYPPKPGGLALVALFLGHQVEVGGGNVIHGHGLGITAFAGIYGFQIILAAIANLDSVKVVSFSVKIANLFILGSTTKEAA